MRYDLLVTGGTVVNGEGTTFMADVAVKNGVIAAVGSIKGDARKHISATGLIVAPGFIDMHSHGDLRATGTTPFSGKVMQGITTEVTGQCGFSAAPVFFEKKADFANYLLPYLGRTDRGIVWRSWREYLSVLRDSPLTTNIVPLVGHGNIRAMVRGMAPGPASRGELAAMCSMLGDIRAAGCAGLSSGLVYPPGVFTPPSELEMLAKMVVDGGIYTSHIRGEGDGIADALREFFRLVERTGVSGEISHLKVTGRRRMERIGEILAMLDRQRARGFEINFDQYPYTAGSTSLSAVLPSWMFEGGPKRLFERLLDAGERRRARKEIERSVPPGREDFAHNCGTWDGVVVNQIFTRRNRRWEGMTVAEISRRRRKSPVECIFDLLLEEEGRVQAIYFSMEEEAVRMVAGKSYGFVGTDGLPGRKPHPRINGTFPRFFAQFVREQHLLSLSEAVFKCSTGPAKKLGLRNRGTVARGMAADIVVFDASRIADRATYEHPNRKPLGIEWVIVNGVVAVHRGSFGGATGGQILGRG